MAHRHRRVTAARRMSRAALVAAPLALAAAGTAVATGVVPTGSAPDAVVRSQPADTGVTRGAETVSRSESRLAAERGERYVRQLQDAYEQRVAFEATRKAVREAHAHLWTTAALNLWSGPEPDARQVGLVDARTRVLVTGRRSGERAELVVHGEPRWVTASYLSRQRPPAPTPTDQPSSKPAAKGPSSAGSGDQPTPSPSAQPSPQPPTAPATQGLSSAPCPDGSVESGLTSSAVRVYRAVCHAFPQVTTYLGYDAHGEHASGKAIDIMINDVSDGKAVGDRIAAFLQSHASELDLYDVIWWDRIWTPVRASEGWRDYGDHGSPTANHMDHVHVSTN